MFFLFFFEACSFENSTGTVHSFHTRKAHNEHDSMFTNTDGHICACGSSLTAQVAALIFVRAKKNPSSRSSMSSPCWSLPHLLSHSLTTTRSTTWTARSSPRTHNFYTTTFSENRKLILLNSRLEQGRKESLQVLSVTTKSRVAEPYEQPTPH